MQHLDEMQVYPASGSRMWDALVDHRLALFDTAELRVLRTCLAAGFAPLAAGGDLGAGEILRSQVESEIRERTEES